MRRLGVLIACSFALFTVSACPGPAGPLFPDITFSHLPPIELDVAEIKVVTVYKPPMRGPNVDHVFPQPPLTVAERWVSDRLRAVGDSGTLTVRILDASAIETELEQSGGLKGAFTKEQAQKYDAVVSMDIEATDPSGKKASARTTARRGMSVREDATVNDREETWYKLTEELMKDFDRAMEGEIRKNFKNFMK